jgi:hypothetical protein
MITFTIEEPVPMNSHQASMLVVAHLKPAKCGKCHREYVPTINGGNVAINGFAEIPNPNAIIEAPSLVVPN